jgi:hypothetical protein
MKYQRGVSLSGLMTWGIVIAMVAILAFKVGPSILEYYKIQKDAKATVNTVQPGATVPEVRKAFAKYAEVDLIDLKPEELEITKDGGQIVINFAYDRKIPLFWNVSLLIEYRGSTAGSSKD